MCEYLISVDLELYGPYHSEEHARYACHVFARKHPDLADECDILTIDSPFAAEFLFEPRLLH